MKRFLSNILLGIVLVAGIGFLSYPTLSNWLNDRNQTRAVATYVEETKDISEEKKEIALEAVKAYNQSLLNKSDRYRLSEEEENAYRELLDVTGTGIMAYVEIPKLDVLLPIYHGTEESVLQIAIGHIPGSSFPIGGAGSHSVISGHRGLPSAKLFTDLDKLESGDYFFINVLGDTLAYRVDKIDIVNPDEIENLEIENDKDYVTLVTCTPYGVNSHRLLVRGERTNYEKPDTKVLEKKVRKFDFINIIPVIVVFALFILFALWMIKRRKK